MSREQKPTLLIFNASSGLSLMPTEFAGAISKKVLGTDGLEYIPTKWGMLEANRGWKSFDSVHALHGPWRSEPAGWKGFIAAVKKIPKGFGETAASFGTVASMPYLTDAENIHHLQKVQQLAGKGNLSLVLSDHKLMETATWFRRRVQITAKYLAAQNIQSPESLLSKFKDSGEEVCVDTAVSTGISNEMMRAALSIATELHIGINRSDVGKGDESLDLSILDSNVTSSLETVTIETVLAKPSEVRELSKAVRTWLNKK